MKSKFLNYITRYIENYYKKRREGDKMVKGLIRGVKRTLDPKNGLTECIISMCLIGAYVFLVVTQKQVPSHFQSAITLILGYYFGKNSQKSED